MQSLPLPIFPIDSKPCGLTYSEWSTKWWQWLLSIPKSNNPAFDSTGNYANVNQNDPNVFFLCQTIESVASVPNRTITLPANRSIFMPIINWISTLHKDGETDREMIAIAKERMDVVANLEVTINGTTIKEGLEKYRARSPFFDIILPEDNIVEVPAGPTRCVSDGYWIFLEPLKKGTKLSSFSSCSSGVTKIRVSYDLNIL
ncbi:MAG: hypothetical protein WCF03_18120 [Nitrososphaeraceae archaeon]